MRSIQEALIAKMGKRDFGRLLDQMNTLARRNSK